MTRYLFRIAPIIVFGFAVVFFDRVPAHSDSLTERRTDVVYDASYRSHSPTHKVIVQSTQNELRDSILAEGGQVLVDYGAFTLMSAPLSSAERVCIQASGSSVRDDMNMLLLRAGAFDTTQGEVASANSLAEPELSEQQLYLVQFIGPIKNQWLNDL